MTGQDIVENLLKIIFSNPNIHDYVTFMQNLDEMQFMEMQCDRTDAQNSHP